MEGYAESYKNFMECSGLNYFHILNKYFIIFFDHPVDTKDRKLLVKIIACYFISCQYAFDYW